MTDQEYRPPTSAERILARLADQQGAVEAAHTRHGQAASSGDTRELARTADQLAEAYRASAPTWTEAAAAQRAGSLGAAGCAAAARLCVDLAEQHAASARRIRLASSAPFGDVPPVRPAEGELTDHEVCEQSQHTYAAPAAVLCRRPLGCGRMATWTVTTREYRQILCTEHAATELRERERRGLASTLADEQTQAAAGGSAVPR